MSHNCLAFNGVITFHTFKTWNVLVHGSFFTEAYWVVRTLPSKALVKVEFDANNPPLMVHLRTGPKIVRQGETLKFEDVSVELSAGGHGKDSTDTVTVTVHVIQVTGSS